MGQFNPIASPSEGSDVGKADGESARQVAFNLLDYPRIDDWYSSLRSSWVSCSEQTADVISFADGRLENPDDVELPAAHLEELKDAALRVQAPLDELEPLLSRTMGVVDDVFVVLREALEQAEESAASPGDDSEVQAGLLQASELLEELPGGIKEITDLADQALDQASYVENMARGYAESFTLNSFIALSELAGDFPMPDPDLIKEQAGALLAASSPDSAAQ